MFLGIDPGITGAVAVLNDDGSVRLAADLPTIANGKSKRQIDANTLAAILGPYAKGIKLAVVEKVSAMPKQGVSSVFNFGVAVGCVRGVLGALGIPVMYVTPTKWKGTYGLTSDKEQSRAMATMLFPAADLHLKKDHNRAEALLLALYASKWADK